MILILITILLCLLLLDYSSKRRRYDLTKNIPGPRIFPLVGNFLFLTQTNVEMAVKNFREFLKHNQTNVGRVWAGHRLFMLTTDLNDLKVILGSSKHTWKHSQYKFFKPWLGDSVFVSSGKKWIRKRKILMPAFSFKCLEGFIELFDKQSAVLIKKLEIFRSEVAFDIKPLVTAAALDIIGESAMGVQLNVQNNGSAEYVKAIADVTKIVGDRAVCIFYQTDLFFKIFAPKMAKKQADAVKVIHDFVDRIVAERRKQLLLMNESQPNSENIEGEETKKNSMILDMLLNATDDAGKSLTDVEIREEVDTIVFAGHDTIEVAVNFALYSISRHQDIQNKLFQEIQEVFGNDKDEAVDLWKLNQLQYLELVIKETLRLYSPAPVIGRRMIEDTEIDGKVYPQGTDIYIPIFMLHMDSKIYTNPEEFRPDRYSDDRLDPYAYLPFSMGPRSCIGHKYAMLEMKCLITKILRNFELLPLGPEPDIKLGVILRSTNGIHLGLKPRIYF